MPTSGQGVAQLSDDAVRRILVRATAAMKQQTAPKGKALMQLPWFVSAGREIKIDYTRTMNAIAFESEVSNADDVALD